MKPRTPQSPLRPNHALRTERPPGTRDLYAALLLCWPSRPTSTSAASIQTPIKHAARLHRVRQASSVLTAILTAWEGVRIGGRRIVAVYDPSESTRRWRLTR